VVAGSDLTSARVRSVVDAHGLTTVSEDLVTVLSTDGDVPAAVQSLRDVGASAAVHHVTFLSPVIKVGGDSGPAAAEGPGTFGALRAARAH